MVDNISVIDATGNTQTMAAEDIGGVKYPRHRLADSAGASLLTGYGSLVQMDIFTAAALGLLAGAKVVHKFGRNENVGSTDETIWIGGGTYAFPPTAGPITVVSSSAQDAAGGTGATSIYIDALDADRAEAPVSVTLTGTTPVVVSSDNWLRVNTAYVSSANSADGDITISIGGAVVAVIPAGVNRTQQAVFTVPSNYTKALIRYGEMTTGSSKAGVGSFWVQRNGFARQQLQVFDITENPHMRNLSIPIAILPEDDVEVVARLSASGAVSSEFDILLLE